MRTYDLNGTKMMLDQFSCNYEILDSGITGEITAETATALGLEPECVFKTLAYIGKSRKIYVFCLPCDKSPSMPKMLKLSGETFLSPLPDNKHAWHTGFTRSALTPIGMKTAFPAFLDSSARFLSQIHLSAGVAGTLVRTTLDSLSRVKYFRFADITE